MDGRVGVDSSGPSSCSLMFRLQCDGVTLQVQRDALRRRGAISSECTQHSPTGATAPLSASPADNSVCYLTKYRRRALGSAKRTTAAGRGKICSFSILE